MNRRWTSLLKLLGMTILLLLYVAPFILVLLNSFKPDAEVVANPLGWPTEFRWDNYVTAFERMNFLSATANSVLITVLSVALIPLIASMAAYVLVRLQWKPNTAIFLTLVAAMIVPFQAIMIPLLKIYGGLGWLNSPWALIFMYLGFGTPFAVFIFHGAVKGISLELEEAATIDGCGRLGVFFRIVLPLLQAVIMTVVILDVLWIWNDFLLPSLVLLAQKNRTLPLSTFSFYGTYTVNYGRLLASLVMTISPVLVLYLFLQKYIIRGITAGSIK